jgi:monoamine oxidase
MKLSRRDMIGAATLLGAAAGLGACTQAQPRTSRAPVGARLDETADILVLGAGLSGLHAANLLREQGRTPLIIEGRDRVGGKVLTHRVGGAFVELGGQNVLGGYGRVLDACRRHKVELIDANLRAPRKAGPPSLILGGELITPKAWESHARNLQPDGARGMLPVAYVSGVLAKAAPFTAPAEWTDPAFARYDTSVHAALKSQGLSEAMIQLGFDVNVGYGSSAHDVSALLMWFVSLWGRQQVALGKENWGAKNGNDTLTDAMAAALGDSIRLGREIVAIENDPGGVVVRCRDGSIFRGKGAICTLPFSTMRTIGFSPALEGAHYEAVNMLPFMQMAHAVLIPKTPFWEKDGLGLSMWSDGPAGMSLAQAYADDPDAVNAFLVFARGKWATYLDRQGPERAKALILADIENARPAARGQLDVVHYYSWSADPFSAGDWGVFAPGQVSRFFEGMIKPFGRIAFAGEHTAELNRGMEGAFEAAERAVFEIASIA